MAVSSRSNSNTVKRGTKRNTGTRGKQTRNTKQNAKGTGAVLRDEIILWSMLAVSVIILISNFGLGGSIGGKISAVFFGIFGFIAYVVPFVIFFTTAFVISNRGNKVAWIKTSAAYVFAISLCAIFEMVVNGYTQGKKFAEFYEFSAKFKTGGGFAGGLLCKIFCPTVGIVGAYVLTIILMIICIVLITERSLFAGMRKKTSRVYENARKDVSRRREISEAKKVQKDIQKDLVKEQELKDVLNKIRAESSGVVVKPREDKKSKLQGESRLKRRVSGVSLDTSFDMKQNETDELHEVMPSLKGAVPVSSIDFTIDRGVKDEADQRDIKPEKKSLKKSRKNVQIDQDLEELQMPEAMQGSDILQNTGETLDILSSSEENAMDFLDMGTTIEKEEVPFEDAFVTEGGADDTDEDDMPELIMPTLKMPAPAPVSPKVKTIKTSPAEAVQAVQTVEQEIEKAAMAVKPEYIFPPINMLNKPVKGKGGNTDKELRDTAVKLQTTLHNFGVDVTVTNVSCGPSVTRYELMPQQGVKVSRIVNLADDIKLNLAAADIRIEAPIPGKSAVGIEVPNRENSAVMLRELLETDDFKKHSSNLCFAAGKDIAGKVVVTDIAKMPHLLIAGATGSGKSVCINTIIMSILYKAKPEDVKLIMIDPKVVELSVYNGIPHLMIPVVTDPKKAAGALNWGVAEMTERYKKFADLNVRDLKGYNAKIESVAKLDDPDGDKPERLPQVVIIVDELADLMMVAPGEVEDSICRLAQLARAAGIHLIIATQRPSVNVITGLIKANMPSRIAFSVSSGVDSRTIIDMNGAEKLLGKGDMLFYPQGYQKPARVQGAFVSDTEVSDVVEFLAQKNMSAEYSKEMEAKISQVSQAVAEGGGSSEVDAHFADAGKFIIEKDKASIGMLQRVFKIGFNRAARIMDQLADAGVVGEEEGTKPRKVLMSMEEFENYIDECI